MYGEIVSTVSIALCSIVGVHESTSGGCIVNGKVKTAIK